MRLATGLIQARMGGGFFVNGEEQIDGLAARDALMRVRADISGMVSSRKGALFRLAQRPGETSATSCSKKLHWADRQGRRRGSGQGKCLGFVGLGEFNRPHGRRDLSGGQRRRGVRDRQRPSFICQGDIAARPW